MNAFSLIRPAAEPSPVIVEVPHAGGSIPEPIAEEMKAWKAAYDKSKEQQRQSEEQQQVRRRQQGQIPRQQQQEQQ